VNVQMLYTRPSFDLSPFRPRRGIVGLNGGSGVGSTDGVASTDAIYRKFPRAAW
jgi:hypothetical protein